MRAAGDWRRRLRGEAVRPRRGSEVQFTSNERRSYRRNFGFGVANGAMNMLGDTLIHPSLVLALFVSQLSNSNLLIGLVPALSVGVWFLPQLVAAALVAGKERQLPYAVWAGVVRALAIAALGVIGFVLGAGSPSTLLLCFFICYTIYNLSAGFANVPMVDVSARVVPPSRRGFYFGQRSFWGGVFGFLAGFVIQRILSRSADFPENFAILFFASFFVLALGALAAALMVEPKASGQRPNASLLAALRDAPRLLTNDHFRRFLTFRSFLSMSAIADPFFVVYAQHELGAPVSIVGFYIAAIAVTQFASNLFWSPLADRLGNRLVLQLAALLRMTIPVVALALPPLFRWGPLATRLPGGNSALYYTFGLVFAIYGVALSGQNLANMTYVLDIAPDNERAAYVGLINTFLGVVAFVPVIGGTLVDAFGFQFLFLIAFLITLIGVMASGALHEPRVASTVNLFSRQTILLRARRVRG
jgi:MFS family permease